LLCVAAPAHASARSDDAAATRAYVRASEEYARAAGVAVAGSVAAIAAEGDEIAQACPAALTYAPRDGAFGELGEELSTTLFDAGVAPMATLRLTFARAIGRLSWSDHRLTELVRGQAAEEAAIVALGLPNACADIAAWRADAFAALPQSAAGFIARSYAIDSQEYVGAFEEREAVIDRLLRKYERPGERSAMKLVERQERRTERTLGVAEEAARAKLVGALGVSTL
jgi:hypothetical protein